MWIRIGAVIEKMIWSLLNGYNGAKIHKKINLLKLDILFGLRRQREFKTGWFETK